jgi:uncharacterized membrane protein YdcZ (DUF606 family)
MDARKILAVVLLVAGVLVLAFRGFSYPEKHEARLGPIEVAVEEEKRVNLPLWLGVGLVVLGGAILLVPSRR